MRRRAVGGTVEYIEVDGPSLAANLNGEPSRRRVAVYLPPGYGREPDKRYPAITLLHGYAGSPEAWLEPAAAWRIDEAMDELIADGAVGEMIVAMPDARTSTGGAFYVDCPGEGGWESFIADDLTEAIDRSYRTLATPKGRAIAGHSVGGYGALRLALRRPDVFGAVYALSPAFTAWGAELSLEAPAWRDALGMRTFDHFDGAPATWWAQILRAACTAFSPDAGAPPLHGALPVRLEDGRLAPDPSAAACWDRALIMGLLEDSPDSVRRLGAIGLDAGQADALRHIPLGVPVLAARLKALGAEVDAEVYDGDHFSALRSRVREVMLPFLWGALSGQSRENKV